MRLFTIAGEPSGDARCSELVRALGSRAPVEIAGMGGPLCGAAGVRLVERMEDYAVMGFGEVLRSVGAFAALEKRLHAACLEFRPDSVVLVDYPGFNMRFAGWARRMGFRVVYYVSPQYWAWGGWRVSAARRNVGLMITLFSFEEEYYRRRGVRCVWAGHPLVDAIPHEVRGGSSLALLPGSREQEVRRLLPVMLEAADGLAGTGLVDGVSVAVAPSVPPGLYRDAASREGAVLCSGTLQALEKARGALVCSGTATLETALSGVPFTVLYGTSALTYGMARLLVTGVERICLASIVAGVEVAPELLQRRMTAGAAIESLERVLAEGPARDDAVKKLSLVRNALGRPGAADRAAEALLAYVGGRA
jgi:lipid-A-disaccharide synthase